MRRREQAIGLEIEIAAASGEKALAERAQAEVVSIRRDASGCQSRAPESRSAMGESTRARRELAAGKTADLVKTKAGDSDAGFCSDHAARSAGR